MRFAGISVFTVWRSELPPGTSMTTPTNILELVSIITVNYFKHFDPQLLFFDSSRLRYFQVENTGMFYSWQIIGILSGFIIILRKLKNKAYRLVLSFILISPIPAALTTGVPFANIGRNLLMFPMLEIICALGVSELLRQLSRIFSSRFVFLFLFIFSLLVGLQFNSFLHSYFIDMPKQFAFFWGQPLKEAIPFVLSYEHSVNEIIITDSFKQAYMYLLFYGNKNPLWLELQPKTKHPVVGYSKIGLYNFRAIDWKNDQYLPNSLLVGTPEEIPENTKTIYEVKQNKEVLLRVVKT